MKRGSNGPSVTYNGAEVSIPSNKGGLIFEQISQYTVIRSNIGFEVRIVPVYCNTNNNQKLQKEQNIFNNPLGLLFVILPSS